MAEIQKISLAEDLVGPVCFGQFRDIVMIGDTYADIKPGPAVFVTPVTGTLIPVMITNIVRKPFGSISRKDAEAQGKTVRQLKSLLKNLRYKDVAITNDTPAYILNFEPPQAAQDILKIMGLMEREFSARGQAHLLNDTVLYFKPDYRIEGDGDVVAGTQAELSFHVDTGEESVLAPYWQFLSAAADKGSLSFSLDRENGTHALIVRGNIETLRERLENARALAAPRRGVISGPLRQP